MQKTTRWNYGPRSSFFLRLLPKNIVEQAFHLTNLECPESYEPIQVARFSGYVLKYNVGDSDIGVQAQFPKSLWNHNDNDGPRTNNSVEGYNFRIGKYLDKHSNIWTFITKLKKRKVMCCIEIFSYSQWQWQVAIETNMRHTTRLRHIQDQVQIPSRRAEPQRILEKSSSQDCPQFFRVTSLRMHF